jgi:hypothetical protein
MHPEIARVLAWAGAFPVWCASVISRWSALIGAGIIAIPLYAYDRFHAAEPFSLTNLAVLLATFFLVGTYNAWYTEHSAARALKERPSFHAYIKNVGFVSEHDWGIAIVARVFIANRGGANSMIHNFEVWANVEGESTSGSIANLPGPLMINRRNRGSSTIRSFELKPQQLIQNSLSGVSFAKGDCHEVLVFANFYSTKMSSLDLDSIIFGFKDAFGGEHLTEGSPRQVLELIPEHHG